MSRIHTFSALHDGAHDLDEDGIPQIAHWNTKGDTPIKATELTTHYAIQVEFEDDIVEPKSTEKTK